MGMVGAGAFDRIIGSHLPDIMGLVTRARGDPTRAFLPLILAAALMIYVMLVVAPRAIADPEARWWPWIVRFLLLLAAAAMGSALVGSAITRLV
jgi:F0F1-type ATP synthase membrane subunit c/vacuolar-type H+-ATPase subunit K